MKIIYLDNNATTRLADEVLQEMLPYYHEYYGNASSMHTFGGQIHKKIDWARGQVARLLNCEPEEIYFTSGGTESDNTAIRGVIEAKSERQHIITSRVEHPAVRTVCRHLQKKGHRLTEVNVDASGRLDMGQFVEALTDQSGLVTIMAANNETGTIFPIPQIAGMVKSRGGILHTDAVQLVGKTPLNLQDTPIDLLSLSGHKLHGPKGVGVLFIRRGTSIVPQQLGGHQELSKRAGTENVPGIVGLGKACELALKNIQEEETRVSRLRDRLEKGLLETCPDARVNGDIEHRLPNTTNISFEYIEGEAILLLMNEVGICASSGSACTSGSLEPSHVLRAMGVPFTAVHGSIRYSLSRYTTDQEVDFVLKEMPPIIKRLRSISMFCAGKDATTAAPCEIKPTL